VKIFISQAKIAISLLKQTLPNLISGIKIYPCFLARKYLTQIT